jgi:hypothetical protein
MVLAEYFFCRVWRLVKGMAEPNKYELTAMKSVTNTI